MEERAAANAILENSFRPPFVGDGVSSQLQFPFTFGPPGPTRVSLDVVRIPAVFVEVFVIVYPIQECEIVRSGRIDADRTMLNDERQTLRCAETRKKS